MENVQYEIHVSDTLLLKMRIFTLGTHNILTIISKPLKVHIQVLILNAMQ